MVFGMSGMTNFVLTNSTNASTAEILYTVFHQKLIHGSTGFIIKFVSVVGVLVLAIMGLCLYMCKKYWPRRTTKMPFTITSSELFETHPIQRVQKSSFKNQKLAEHKNIITPDRHIAFVIPTIPLHTQSNGRELSQASNGNGDASTSQGHSLSRVPMIEKQYYPQLHTEDSTLPRISFSLFYQLSSQILFVKIIGGNNFPEEEAKTYGVQVKLYPGRGKKEKTKDYPGGNPIFNQDFKFTVRKQVLQTKVLKLRIVEMTSSSNPKTLLGVVNLAMKDLPVVSHEDVQKDFRTGTLWRKVELPSSIGHGVRLDISLKWALEPSPGLLVLKIREAYGLHEITETEYTSTYVKVTLEEHGRIIKSRKTRLLRWGTHPNYDDTFVVTIPFELLSQISFTLTLVARGRLGSKAILGRIKLGSVTFANPQSGITSGTEFWEDMCHQPNTEISRWLQLFQ